MSRIIRALRRKVSDYKLRRKILKSDLFSLRWYLEAYTDVAEAGVDPYQHYLESGWREGRNPGPKFDTNGYLAANPDVRNAGVNPLVHYIVSGKAEGRLLNTEYLRRSPRRKPASRNADQAGVVVFEKSILSAPTDDHRFAVFSVAFMVADQKGESTRYRVHNVIEALRRRNVEAVHFEDQDIPGRMEQILSNDIVVLFRYPWGPDVEQLIAQAREKAIPLVYDVDDYIFDPAVSSRIDGVRMLTEPDKALYQKGVLRYRKCLENCDYATAPTEFLARMETDLVKKSYVIVNTLNQEQLQICQEIVNRETITRSDWVTLGYFSGSLTHQKDFEQALPSLLRVFEDFLNVRLIIKGEFELDEFPGLRRFEDRIALQPFSHWRELPLAISQVDINLIPLEPNSLFCESKSELKYFEAAILGKPSVASEVGPYKNVIEHGRNGLLAQNPETWYECLRCLIVDPSFRKSLGEAAREHVLKNYVPEKLAQDAETVYQDILDDYRRRKRRVSRKNRTSVSFITPCPKPGSGGHKDIFVLSNVLADLGSEVNIYFVPSPEFSSSGQLEDMLFTHFLEPRFNVILGVDVAPCDALFATHFSTAYHVKENLFAAKKGFYFVQDYEPYFYPVSEDYIRAVTTYSMGFHCITLGRWLQQMLKQKHDCDSDAIPFWIERDIYYQRPQSGHGLPKIAFLARPEMPRRCFNLGTESLDIFHRLNPEVGIVLFGSEETRKHKLPFKHTDLGVVHKSKLGALYSEMKIGLAFGPTNPSFVPYEMMASGCPVVDISLDKNFDYLKFGSNENAMLMPPDPKSIASALSEILKDEPKRRRLVSNGLDFVSTLPSVAQAGEMLAEIIDNKLKN